MLLHKAENRVCMVKNSSLFMLSWLVTIVFFLTSCSFASPPLAIDATELASTTELIQSDVVDAVCSLIYQGKFDSADDLIKKSSQGQPQIRQLAKIVQQYKEIAQQRQLSKESAYQEQLAKLEKFRTDVNINDIDIGDVNDANDANSLPSIFAVIAKVAEFADDQQKQELLQDTFVKKIFQKAKDKASEFESQGKWLDAYIKCYWWLQIIDKDNKEYSDYTKQLLEKANIVASFQDSPCESSKERYEKVKKKIFVRAIEVLNFNYVNIIDYQQVVTKAIERCALLADVMEASYSEISKDGDISIRSEQGKKSSSYFVPPNDEQLTAWARGLAMLLSEVNQSRTGIAKGRLISVFEKVLKLNETTVKLPQQVLIAQFTEASLSALDPYTVVVWPKQVQDFEKLMTNEFTGIGIEISKAKGFLTVASLLPDTPAYNSGLDAGDVIEKVDGIETKDMTLTCAVKTITGPAGTKVNLTVRGPGGGNTRDITIIRARIIVPTIRGWQRTEEGKWLHMIDDQNKIGYARLTNFSEKSASDFKKVVNQLEAKGLKGLILDLRYNTGGLLNSAIEIVDMFLQEGLIVRTQPRFGLPTYAGAKKKNTRPNYPLVILINSASASASEIVAGALADTLHKRAVLVGERTHGKGSVQGITGYPGSGAQLKYTMAYYHLPSGQRVESKDAMKKLGRKDWGVGPNVEVKLRSNELGTMLEFPRDNNVPVKACHDNDIKPLEKHSVEETLTTDHQLAVEILVIKSKLIQAGSLILNAN